MAELRLAKYWVGLRKALQMNEIEPFENGMAWRFAPRTVVRWAVSKHRLFSALAGNRQIPVGRTFNLCKIRVPWKSERIGLSQSTSHQAEEVRS